MFVCVLCACARMSCPLRLFQSHVAAFRCRDCLMNLGDGPHDQTRTIGSGLNKIHTRENLRVLEIRVHILQRSVFAHTYGALTISSQATVDK